MYLKYTREISKPVKKLTFSLYCCLSFNVYTVLEPNCCKIGVPQKYGFRQFFCCYSAICLVYFLFYKCNTWYIVLQIPNAFESETALHFKVEYTMQTADTFPHLIIYCVNWKICTDCKFSPVSRSKRCTSNPSWEQPPLL